MVDRFLKTTKTAEDEDRVELITDPKEICSSIGEEYRDQFRKRDYKSNQEWDTYYQPLHHINNNL